ncbi:MAG: site-2 protease family protein [Candidatus Marinimicrobia bacterium]|nr:site-2 protease family protein [Candidatus Neomarinimicrobiota bacterium]
MNSSIKLGKILGIPIGVNYSWIFVFVLFILVLSRQFSQNHLGWDAPQIWATALITTVLFFLSVLVHEMSHSLVAVRKGIPVIGITLFVFGGVSQLSHEARRPMTEFLIAVVGPLTSILLAVLFAGLKFALSPSALHWEDVLLTPGRTSLGAISLYLAWVNMSLGIFNLLPGFPLDGGRVLRAVVWGISGSYWRGTQVAARAGQFFGGLIIASGLALLYFGHHFQGIWFALIGLFLFSAATASYRQEKNRESMRSFRVADVFTTSLFSLPSETALGSPLVSQGLTGPEAVIGVMADNRIQGVVTRQNLALTPAGSSPFATLGQVMVPLASLPSVGPEEGMYEALERMETDGIARLAVVSDGRLLGFLAKEEVLRFMVRRRSGRA